LASVNARKSPVWRAFVPLRWRALTVTFITR
jgi:hypothetical protein